MFSNSGFDCLFEDEMTTQGESGRPEVAPPSPVRISMNLDLDGMIQKQNIHVEQQPVAFLAQQPLPMRNDEPMQKNQSVAGNLYASGPVQNGEIPRSSAPRIRIKREQEKESLVDQKVAKISTSKDVKSHQEKKSPKFHIVKGAVPKDHGEKFRREPVSILVIVGLAVMNAGIPVPTGIIYDFFRAHFVKYTEADEKNKHSWMNTVRTKLTFADKFTKIPAPDGSRTNTKYILNLTNGNWLEKGLVHLDRNNFFADSGLVEPKVWDQMRRGELGLPGPTVITKRVQQPMPRAVLMPVRRAVTPQKIQRSRGEQSLLALNSRNTTTAIAERPVNMRFGTSHQPAFRPRPSPYPAVQQIRQPLAQVENQKSSLSDTRAFFSRALQNQQQLKNLVVVPSQQRRVPAPHPVQRSLPLEQNCMHQEQSVSQPPAVSSPQPFLDFDNMPIEDFDAAKMLGLS